MDLSLKQLLTKITQRLSITGTTYINSRSNLSITSTDINTYTQGASVTLPAGTYVIKGGFSFNTYVGATNRVVDVDLSTVAGSTADTAPLGRARTVNSAGNWVRLEAVTIVTFNSQTTVYVKASSTYTCTGSASDIRAIRIA